MGLSHIFSFIKHASCSTSALSWPLITVSCSGWVSPCWSSSGTLGKTPLLVVRLLLSLCLGGGLVGWRPLPPTTPSMLQAPVTARLPGAGDFGIGDTYHRGKLTKQCLIAQSFISSCPGWRSFLFISLLPSSPVGKWPLSDSTLWRPLQSCNQQS